jgi:hypothetical protein
MLVYLRVDMVDGCKAYTAYHSVSMAPSYIWRYTNYAEGVNFYRTYVHRNLIYNSRISMSLGII